MANQGDRKGPQQHAEGQQGEKTHQRFVEQLNEGRPREMSGREADHAGDHRLREDREQHDEAEKNSEKTRLAKETGREDAGPDQPSLNGRPPHGA